MCCRDIAAESREWRNLGGVVGSLAVHVACYICSGTELSVGQMSHELQALLDAESRQGIANSWGRNPLTFLEGNSRSLCLDWLESCNIFCTKRFFSYFPHVGVSDQPVDHLFTVLIDNQDNASNQVAKIDTSWGYLDSEGFSPLHGKDPTPHAMPHPTAVH